MHAKTHNDRCNEHGTSLIELMLGSAAILVFLGAVLTTATHSSSVRKQHQERAMAFAAARNQIEELRAVPFATLPTFNGRGFDVPSSNGSAGGLSPQAGDADHLPGIISVEVDSSGSGETMYRIRVRVDWTGSGGKRNLQLQTLISDRRRE